MYVIFLGAPGTGKTTLARKLSKKYDYLLFDISSFFNKLKFLLFLNSNFHKYDISFFDKKVSLFNLNVFILMGFIRRLFKIHKKFMFRKKDILLLIAYLHLKFLFLKSKKKILLMDESPLRAALSYQVSEEEFNFDKLASFIPENNCLFIFLETSSMKINKNRIKKRQKGSFYLDVADKKVMNKISIWNSFSKKFSALLMDKKYDVLVLNADDNLDINTQKIHNYLKSHLLN